MVDLANAFQGGLTGATTGSPYGLPGIIGGGVLGFGAGLLGFGKDKKSEIKEYKNYSPQQEQMLDRLHQMAMEGNEKAYDWYMRILSGDESAFDEFEAPEMERFQQETVPGILERFSYGPNGGMSKGSSALNNSLGAAAKSLSLGLSAQRANLKNQAAQGIEGFANKALQPRTTKYAEEGQSGGWSALAGPAAEGYKHYLNSRNAGAAGRA